jgi:methionine biosynthesis protein MetW
MSRLSVKKHVAKMPKLPARSRAAPRRPGDIRIDLRLIADMIAPGSRVLDIGCGDGLLLEYLVHEKKVDGRGIELGMDGVHVCVSHGLSVIQGNAETDLADYPDDAFDYVVLSQTLQAMHNPKAALQQLSRIGRSIIVSLPNFGYWRVRAALLLDGRMPVSDQLSYQWWETPNIHLCTIADFVALAQALGLTIERSLILGRRNRIRQDKAHTRLANLLGVQGVFLLRREQ